MRRLRFDLVMGVIMSCLITASHADQINIDDFKRDVIRLEAFVARARETLSQSVQGKRQLAELESQLSKLKICLGRMADLVSQIQTKDGRIRYYLDSELGPKQREVDRINQQILQLNEEYEQWAQKAKARCAIHNANHPDPKNQGAVSRYNAEAAEINSERDAKNQETAQAGAKINALIERAIANLTRVQKELSEIRTQREKLAKQLMEASSEFGGIRVLFTKNATSLPAATTTVPLTAFPKGVSYEEAKAAGYIAPRPLLPIGPGTNTRAIDQLRVITTSSEHAIQAEEKRAKEEIGYGFDTGGGLPPAPMIKVTNIPSEAPEQNAKSEPPTPLVLVDPPTQHEKAVKDSPVMQAVGKKQTQAVTRLEELYTRRARERDRGTAASPVKLAEITNELSSALSEAARAAGEQRMLAFGITPPQQRTHGIKDITVPSPQPPPK